MKYLLIIIFLSSGQYTQTYATLEDCHDGIIEAELIKGNEVWSAMCVGTDDEVYAALGEVSP